MCLFMGSTTLFFSLSIFTLTKWRTSYCRSSKGNAQFLPVCIFRVFFPNEFPSTSLQHALALSLLFGKYIMLVKAITKWWWWWCNEWVGEMHLPACHTHTHRLTDLEMERKNISCCGSHSGAYPWQEDIDNIIIITVCLALFSIKKSQSSCCVPHIHMCAHSRNASSGRAWGSDSACFSWLCPRERELFLFISFDMHVDRTFLLWRARFFHSLYFSCCSLQSTFWGKLQLF